MSVFFLSAISGKTQTQKQRESNKRYISDYSVDECLLKQMLYCCNCINRTCFIQKYVSLREFFLQTSSSVSLLNKEYLGPTKRSLACVKAALIVKEFLRLFPSNQQPEKHCNAGITLCRIP